MKTKDQLLFQKNSAANCANGGNKERETLPSIILRFRRGETRRDARFEDLPMHGFDPLSIPRFAPRWNPFIRAIPFVANLARMSDCTACRKFPMKTIRPFGSTATLSPV